MKANKLKTIISEFDTPVIYKLIYDLKNLTIFYEANRNENYTITFDSPIAFKCLDERDMMDYWEHEVFTDNWILEIIEGGWLNMEKSRRMISHKMYDLREYLIEGNDECLTVLSSKEPQIEKIKTTHNTK